MNMEEIKLPLQSVTKVIGLDVVDSTQSLARTLALQGAEDGTLVLAGAQTSGRGRYDRSFSAAEGGVYFTLILRPGKPVSANSSLSVRAGQAVSETISSVFDVKTKIKEPNDVLAWDKKSKKWKKICGILIESSSEGDCDDWLLVGIGINVNNRLSASLKESAISLKQLIGSETSKELFLDELLDNFWKHYAHWLRGV
jgi:BirA family biotin operon repressor/biotin-[acetyl-CoA-carboxylase] ligase